MFGYGISKYDLKTINRMQIMRTIWECGPISRSDIAGELGITRAAITVITNEMLEEGLIKEVGKNTAEKNGTVQKGRRKVLLELNADSCFIIGIYIDRHNLSVGMTTLKGDILEKNNLIIKPDISYEEMICTVETAVKTLLQNSCLSYRQVIGVGIGLMPDVPDFVKEGIEADPRYYYNIQNELTQHWDLPIYVGNALSQFAIVSSSKREYSGMSSINGQLYSDGENFYLSYVVKKPRMREQYDTTTGLNFMCIKHSGCEEEGYPRGSVKSELTPKAIGRKVSGIFSIQATPALYRLTGGDCTTVTLSQISEAVKNGDEMLRSLCSELFDEMCIFLNNVVSVIGADRMFFYKCGFTEELIGELIAYGKERYSKLNETEFSLSDISDEQRFTCGCGYAAFMGVFGLGDKT
ncbi:MAG: MarR family transcriptional regulator [Ruminococcus sp.]